MYNTPNIGWNEHFVIYSFHFFIVLLRILQIVTNSIIIYYPCIIFLCPANLTSSTTRRQCKTFTHPALSFHIEMMRADIIRAFVGVPFISSSVFPSFVRFVCCPLCFVISFILLQLVVFILVDHNDSPQLLHFG